MKILLATDGSEYSKKAVEQLAEMPHNSETQIRVLSVFESFPILIMPAPGPAGGIGGYYEEMTAAARKSAEESVSNAAGFLKEKNPALAIDTAVVNGSPKEIILKAAAEFDADLIVVGSHGRGAFSRFLMGSVSQSMALHASCSVLIVRKQEAKDERK